MSCDGDDVRMSLGHSRGNGSDSGLRYQFDIDFRVRIGVLQIEDQLRKIFDGIDIVMGRRRYQGHAGS